MQWYNQVHLLQQEQTTSPQSAHNSVKNPGRGVASLRSAQIADGIFPLKLLLSTFENFGKTSNSERGYNI